MSASRLEAMIVAKFGPATHSMGAKGLELIVTCPMCGEPKLTINTVNGIYKCWRGCMSGTIAKLFNPAVMKLIDKVAAARQINEARRREAAKVRGIPEPGELIPLAGLGPNHPACQYLRARSFDPKELGETYGMMYCREGVEFARGVFNTSNTLVVPMYVDGELVGWQSRLLYNPDTVDDKTCAALNFLQREDGRWIRPPKYFTSPGFAKGKSLFNYDNARKGNVVVVTEGVFDAMRVGCCAVAVFGKSVSSEQLGMLRSYWDIVVILLDPDADEEAQKLHLKLNNSVVVTLTGYKDAGEAPQEEIWKQIAQSTNNLLTAKDGRTIMDYEFPI